MRWPWTKTIDGTAAEASRPPVTVGAIDGLFDEFSPTWAFIKQHLDKEVNELRKRNDSLNLDDRKTVEIRGRIAALNELAELPKKLSREKSRLDNARHNAG